MWTGPLADHTSGKGHFLYLNEPNRIARLRSPTIQSTDPRCIHLFYHMFGEEVGHLRIYAQSPDGTKEEVWRRKRNQGLGWQRAFGKIQPGLYEVIIEGHGGRGPRSTIAIDDVYIDVCSNLERDCKVKASGPYYQGHRDFTRSGKKCQRWDSPSVRQYNMRDASMFPDEKIQDASNYCRNPSRYSTSPWCFTVEKDAVCEPCEVPICPCRDHEFQCDVCISKIDMCDGKMDCKNGEDEKQCEFKNCDFEDGTPCSYHITPGENDYTWKLNSGSTPSSETGPFIDATKQSPEGTYIYTESSKGVIGEKTTLRTSPKRGIRNAKACLRFSYHAYGSNLGDLAIYVQEESRPKRKLWEMRRWKKFHARAEFSEDRWIPFSVEFEEAPSYVILFEASRGDGFRGDQALDDISIREGKCDVPDCKWYEYRCDNGLCINRVFLCDDDNNCLDESDEGQQCYEKGGECKFETPKLCGYTVRHGTAQFTWAAYTFSPYLLDWQKPANFWYTYTHDISSGFAGTGPKSEGTQGTFMAVDSKNGTVGAESILSSPIINTDNETCLHFSYHMNGRNMGKLRVIQKFANKTEVNLVMLMGHHGLDWLNHSASLAPGEFEVQFIARRGDGITSNMAIDNVRLELDLCPEVANESGECADGNYQEYKGQMATTWFGSACKPWYESPSPRHIHLSKNYCRADDERDFGPWCYAWNGAYGAYGATWDYCRNFCPGYYMYTTSHRGEQGSTTTLSSPLYDFQGNTNHSLEFYHHMKGSDIGTLEVFLLTDGFLVQRLVEVKGNQGPDWVKAAVAIPSVTAHRSRVVFRGTRGDGIKGDIAIDDVSLNQVEFNAQDVSVYGCIRTRVGSEYSGTVSWTKSGKACMPWRSDSVVQQLKKLREFAVFPDGTLIQANNFCRNPDLRKDGPWCFTSDMDTRGERCDVPFCDCTEGQFQCTNGMCVDSHLLCNGVDNCGDRSDEETPCNFSVGCGFEDSYSCGYSVRKAGSGFTWTRTENHLPSLHTNPNLTCKSSGSVMIADACGFANGVAELVSPPINISMPHCLHFCYYIDGLGTSKLNVLKERASTNSGKKHGVIRKNLFFSTGEPVNQWLRDVVQLPAGQYNVIFQAHLLKDSISQNRKILKSCPGTLAVDEVAIVPGICKDQFKCPDLPPCSDEAQFECLQDRHGSNYIGHKNVTLDGYDCQRWDMQSPHKHQFKSPSDFPDASVPEASNFCRNPDANPAGPWCYTTDRTIAWQSCDIPICAACGEEFQCKSGQCRSVALKCDGDPNCGDWSDEHDSNCPTESTLMGPGATYTGTLNITESGKPCMNWAQQIARRDNMIKFGLDVTDFPDKSIEDAKNYCRNPNQDPKGPWCITSKRWDIDYCDIPRSCTSTEFECDNEVCVHKETLCDGENDCGDFSDETKPCTDQMSATCNFLTKYNCGYRVSPVGRSLYKWVPEYITEADKYERFMGVDVQNGVRYKSRTSLISPPVRIPTTDFACVKFVFKISDFDAVVLKLHAQYKTDRRRQIWESFNKTGEEWKTVYTMIKHEGQEFRLVFESIAGLNNKGPAIDSVEVNPGYCDVGKIENAYNYKTEARPFYCENGYVIDEDKKCDGYNDCMDFTDELNGCVCNGSDVFQCTTGLCIAKSLVCNEIDDCGDGSDEAGCDELRQFFNNTCNDKNGVDILRPTLAIDSGSSRENNVTSENPGIGHKRVELTPFLFKAAHQFEDLIHRCFWDGQPCEKDSFKPVLTDYGVCYSFNGATADEKVKVSERAGSRFGLSLILNIEQYEYMLGPNKDAGVKVFLHPQDEIPQVRELGFTVAPGMHALVAVKKTSTKSLKKPHGTCGIMPLDYYQQYTTGRCLLEHETKRLVQACGCRDAYMLGEGKGKDDPPVCDTVKYIDCVLPLLKQRNDKQAQCIQPCNTTFYEPVISYATISDINVDRVLRGNISVLNETFLNAREGAHRVDPERFTIVYELLHELNKSYTKFLSVLSDILEVRIGHKYVTQRIENSKRNLIDMYRKDARSITGFVSPYRVWYVVKVHPFVLRLTEVLGQLPGNLFILLDGSNAFSNDIRSKAKLEVQNFYNLYNESMSEFLELSAEKNARYLPDFFFGSDTIPCAQSRVYVEENCKYALGHSNKSNINIVLDMTNLVSEIEQFGRCLNLYNSTLSALSSLEAVTSNSYSGAKLTSDEHIESLLKVSNARAHTDMMLEYNLMGEMTKTEIAAMSNPKIAGARESINKIYDVAKGLEERKSKQLNDLQEEVAQSYKNIAKKCQQFDTFFSDTGRKGPCLGQLWAMEIWKRYVPDITLFGQSNTSSAPPTEQLIDVDSYLQEHVEAYLEPVWTMSNKLGADLSDHHGLLLEYFTKIQTRLQRYLKGNSLDAKFVANNFLSLDVYFAQLSYQRIEQMRDINEGSLLSEIGGLMGLLLGASVITIFELLDMIIYNFILKRTAKVDRRNSQHPEELEMRENFVKDTVETSVA
ncbi:uncharacterized protein LOC106171691 [Lingula anatina]|uniref:Uncharacterized protein LOC106171691 n=1 Tax=Lingula anatina TaxID=7574 RepID=A0A1S3JCI0_LINAN|nr:uncharacterized protein LOC106171691 [Lingula anatina]|eukprot:XP_013407589.2 uncharacterized protein LOC106171691 [Lingula anatina]